ncbi:MAG: nickel pincer cofactor biosynthesis protein LarC, partial [Desulfobacterales bacterium]
MLAYFDCFSGISGDMTLGAFIDLGVPLNWLKENIARIPLTGFDLIATPVHRSGIQAQLAQVACDDDKISRNFAEIEFLIANSPLSNRVKEISLQIFAKIAQAEAGIHGCPLEQVHFHEIGGTDAIVDIVGTALCLEYLGIQKVVASRIPLGSGFVVCRHGKLPVPAPATLAILDGVPVYGTGVAHELVTPTGAGIIVTLAQSFAPLPDMIIQKVGYGAGQRELESGPNLLRIITGSERGPRFGPAENVLSDQVLIVETCIDDMNPEFFGFVMERLFADGALDVYWVPI